MFSLRKSARTIELTGAVVGLSSLSRGVVQKDFALLPVWCDRFEELNPGSRAVVEVDPTTKQYVALTIVVFPLVQRTILGAMRLALLDGAFTKHTQFKGQMLLYSFRDGNNNLFSPAVRWCLQVCHTCSVALLVACETRCISSAIRR